jgi:hypothetical protein
VDRLFDAWGLVSNVEDPYLSPASLARFGIKCHNLLQESSFDEAPYATKFFRKVTHEKLQEYLLTKMTKKPCAGMDAIRLSGVKPRGFTRISIPLDRPK